MTWPKDGGLCSGESQAIIATCLGGQEYERRTIGYCYQDTEKVAVAAEFKATNPQPKKPWIAHVAKVLKADVVPLHRIDAERRQCSEGLAWAAEGLMEEAEAWFWPGHPRAVWCRAHRKAGPRRRSSPCPGSCR